MIELLLISMVIVVTMVLTDHTFAKYTKSQSLIDKISFWLIDKGIL